LQLEAAAEQWQNASQSDEYCGVGYGSLRPKHGWSGLNPCSTPATKRFSIKAARWLLPAAKLKRQRADGHPGQRGAGLQAVEYVLTFSAS
jgi:hypothetical protein